MIVSFGTSVNYVTSATLGTSVNLATSVNFGMTTNIWYECPHLVRLSTLELKVVYKEL